MSPQRKSVFDRALCVLLSVGVFLAGGKTLFAYVNSDRLSSPTLENHIPSPCKCRDMECKCPSMKRRLT